VHEGTPIFYRQDKYELVDQGVFWLSDRPCIPSKGWDTSLPRITGWAVLRDKETGFTYAHFNTHFDNRGELARTNSARLVADRINARSLPTVLTGDLNVTPGSTPTQYLEAGGLIDLRKEALDSDTGGTFHGYRAGTGILDYIYANHYLRGAAQFKVIRDEYDGQYPSDHFAVSATLTLAN
ncbi:MAG: endonuclease/exonuclease/phosphatase family protein, partial [Oscillospiraceae bacterium]|nr:endonuclease/exonuclease/phosphatase family protein [Oscillospiraceae bacterium]